jgi:hypothetical protein
VDLVELFGLLSSGSAVFQSFLSGFNIIGVFFNQFMGFLSTTGNSLISSR